MGSILYNTININTNIVIFEVLGAILSALYMFVYVILTTNIWSMYNFLPSFGDDVIGRGSGRAGIWVVVGLQSLHFKLLHI